MEMNCELHNLGRRRLTFHKIYLDRVATTVEAADSCIRHSNSHLIFLVSFLSISEPYLNIAPRKMPNMI